MQIFHFELMLSVERPRCLWSGENQLWFLLELQSTLNFIGTPFVALNVMECFDVKIGREGGKEGRRKSERAKQHDDTTKTIGLDDGKMKTDAMGYKLNWAIFLHLNMRRSTFDHINNVKQKSDITFSLR